MELWFEQPHLILNIINLWFMVLFSQFLWNLMVWVPLTHNYFIINIAVSQIQYSMGHVKHEIMLSS